MPIDFLWDVSQQQQLGSLARDTKVASRKARRTAHTLADTQASVERLSLTCHAMWELLRERTSVTEEDLLAKVREIDLRDGLLDGKVTSPAKQCSQCSRGNNPRREKCVYCGTQLADGPAFSRI